jgi:hypothetical protein
MTGIYGTGREAMPLSCAAGELLKGELATALTAVFGVVVQLARMLRGAAELDVVGRPVHPEALAAGRQLTDEMAEAAVVGGRGPPRRRMATASLMMPRQAAKKSPDRGSRR